MMLEAMKVMKLLVRVVREEKLLVLVGMEVKLWKGMKLLLISVEWCQLLCEVQSCFYFAGKMQMR